jgi:D-glycero-alpha-D-manno-heptose 1-phosphate guanylyltransferase
MIIHEAIVLAGGMGTRLKDAVPDLPKCMAPINGIPFITYLIKHLQAEGIQRFVFALGYRSEMIEGYLQANRSWINASCSIEEKQLGTGGAIQKAMKITTSENVLIVNGDTLFKANIHAVANLHDVTNAICTLALKPMNDSSRYGSVRIDEHQQVTGFGEKNTHGKGLVNGGVYLLNRQQWDANNWPETFSFETDFLQKKYRSQKLIGIVQDEYFIDIGIPEDYAKAQTELATF